MRSIGVLASAIALVLCGCEVGAGDGTVPPAQVRMEASAPVVQPVLSPEAAREPGVDPSVVLPAVDTPGGRRDGTDRGAAVRRFDRLPEGGEMKTLAMTGLALLILGSAARATADEWVTVSAPIFPQVLVLYEHEGANFPATIDEEAAVAHAAALNFQSLLVECQADYPGITLLGPEDPPLTPEQLTANFDLVARRRELARHPGPAARSTMSLCFWPWWDPRFWWRASISHRSFSVWNCSASRSMHWWPTGVKDAWALRQASNT